MLKDDDPDEDLIAETVQQGPADPEAESPLRTPANGHTSTFSVVKEESNLGEAFDYKIEFGPLDDEEECAFCDSIRNNKSDTTIVKRHQRGVHEEAAYRG